MNLYLYLFLKLDILNDAVNLCIVSPLIVLHALLVGANALNLSFLSFHSSIRELTIKGFPVSALPSILKLLPLSNMVSTMPLRSL